MGGHGREGRVGRLSGGRGTQAGPAVVAAGTMAGRASVGADGVSVILPDGVVHTVPGSPMVFCIVAVDGRFWIGHDRGITVLDEAGRVIDRLRLAGPVRYVFPLAAGGAAWVSETGGFGTVILNDPGASSYRH